MLDTSVGAVLCGLDTSLNYTKLSKAFQYLTRNEGCLFLATNEDRYGNVLFQPHDTHGRRILRSTYPAGAGVLPGAGSISAPLRYALKRDPTSIGKPNKTMLDCIRAKSVIAISMCCPNLPYFRSKHFLCFQRHPFDPARTMMVGDRLDTDIQFGKNGGLGTLLVFTGVTSERDLVGLKPDAVPDFVTQSLGDLAVLSGS